MIGLFTDQNFYRNVFESYNWDDINKHGQDFSKQDFFGSVSENSFADSANIIKDFATNGIVSIISSSELMKYQDVLMDYISDFGTISCAVTNTVLE